MAFGACGWWESARCVLKGGPFMQIFVKVRQHDLHLHRRPVAARRGGGGTGGRGEEERERERGHGGGGGHPASHRSALGACSRGRSVAVSCDGQRPPGCLGDQPVLLAVAPQPLALRSGRRQPVTRLTLVEGCGVDAGALPLLVMVVLDDRLEFSAGPRSPA